MIKFVTRYAVSAVQSAVAVHHLVGGVVVPTVWAKVHRLPVALHDGMAANRAVVNVGVEWLCVLNCRLLQADAIRALYYFGVCRLACMYGFFILSD